MDTIITAEYAAQYLQRIVGLRVCCVSVDQDRTISIGVGKQYELSNLVINDNGSLQENISRASEYVFLTKSKIQFWEDSVCQNLRICEIQSAQIAKIERIMQYRRLEKINVRADNVIELVSGCYKICIMTENKSTESWRVLQPGTDEDQLIGYVDKLIKYERKKRRWSTNHSAVRDQWHSIPLLSEDNACGIDAQSILNNLVGMEITYGLKSCDVNLLDIGFGSLMGSYTTQNEYALHVTCSSLLCSENGSTICLWGDTDSLFFEKHFSTFIGQRVEKITLLADNLLQIKLERYCILIIPADDGMESWRIFALKSNTPHLIAADRWITYI